MGLVIVEYFDREKLIDSFSEDNMIMDMAGEILCDMLTISPSLSAIQTASSLLDASNYTIHAISFGKDAQGYRTHGHDVRLNNEVGNQIIHVVSYEANTVSSYHGSATTIFASSLLNNTYKQFPQPPTPMDTRLERNTTAVIPGDLGSLKGYDIGHNLNILPFEEFFDYGDAIINGCFAPRTGSPWKILSSVDSTGYPIVTGTFSGTFNLAESMDLSGFCNVLVSSADHGNSIGGSSVTNISGLVPYAGASFSSTGEVGYHVTLSGGDAGTASLYGGIFHIGLWALDIRSMLDAGTTPPFAYTPPLGTNARKYRLFAKKSFNKDITYFSDSFTTYQSKAININWIIRF